MREKILTVEDHFQLTGRGLVVLGKIEKTSPVIKTGDPLIIVAPDGREVGTKLGGVEMTNPPNFELLGIWLPELTKDDVPAGSIVFAAGN